MKKLLIIIGAVFAFLIVVLLIIPFVVPVDRFRGEIENRINSQVNGQVSLGEIRLSVFPWVGVRINSLVVRNGEAFQKSELLRVAEAGLKVKVMPLFQGKILGEIHVDRPIIRLETLPDGKTSLAALMKSPSQEKKTETPAKPVNPKVEQYIRDFELKSLSLKDGEVRTITYDSKNAAQTGTDITHLNLELKNLVLKGEMPVFLSAAVFNSDKPDLTFKGLLQTDLDPLSGNHHIDIKSSSLQLGQIVTKITGAVDQKAGKPLMVDLKTDSSGISLSHLPQDLPTLKGKLPPELSGDMNIVAKIHGPASPTDDLHIDAVIDSGLLQFKKFEFEKLHMETFLHQKVMDIKNFKTQFFGSEMTGEGKVFLQGPRIDFALKQSGVEINQVMTAMASKKDVVFGKADLNLNIKGDLGEKPPEGAAGLIPHWLKADGKLHLGPGRFATLNLMNDVVKTLIAIAPLEPGIRNSLNQVDWKSLDSNFHTDQATIFLDNMQMDYTASSAQLAGTVSPQSKLDMKGNVAIANSIVKQMGQNFSYMTDKSGRLILPVKITGTVDTPKTMVDLTSLLKSAAKEAIKQNVPPEIKGLFSDLLKKPPSQ